MHSVGQNAGGVVSVRPWSGLVGIIISAPLIFLLPTIWWILLSSAIFLVAGIAARYIDVMRSRAFYHQRKHVLEQAENMFSKSEKQLKNVVLVRPAESLDQVWVDVSPQLYRGCSQMPLDEIIRLESSQRGEQLICVDDSRFTNSDESQVRAALKEVGSGLLIRAERIYVLPGATKGGVWLASFLKSNDLIGKVVFIMPSSRFVPFERYVRYWASIRTLYKSIGIELVKYNSLGGLFTLKGRDCTPFFLIEPATNIDSSLFSIAAMLVSFQKAEDDRNASLWLRQIKTKLRGLRRSRFDNVSEEAWGRYLFSPDKVFVFIGGRKQRLQ